MPRPIVTTLVVDLDNTLWDWVEIWYQSFSAMLAKVCEISDLTAEELYPHIAAVHQRHGTSEYSFLLEELDVLRTRHPGADIRAVYDDAIHAYAAARKATLHLYPTVAETLRSIRARGTLIVGYTESQEYYTQDRIRRLGLDGLLAIVYAPADHVSDGIRPAEVRSYPPEHYQLKSTEQRYTPAGEYKPNPDVLRTILADTKSKAEFTAYVGDSPHKDIAMARECAVFDVYAEYGKAQQRPEYDLLRKVTHWTKQDVEREREIHARGNIQATFVLVKSFSEILQLFEFAPHESTDTA